MIPQETLPEIESMIFSIKGPKPGIFSIVFSIFLTTESHVIDSEEEKEVGGGYRSL
jgi:hypothetical protein